MDGRDSPSRSQAGSGRRGTRACHTPLLIPFQKKATGMSTLETDPPADRVHHGREKPAQHTQTGALIDYIDRARAGFYPQVRRRTCMQHTHLTSYARKKERSKPPSQSNSVRALESLPYSRPANQEGYLAENNQIDAGGSAWGLFRRRY